MELKDFINPSQPQYLGKYNFRFNEKYQQTIENIISLHEKKLYKNVN